MKFLKSFFKRRKEIQRIRVIFDEYLPPSKIKNGNEENPVVSEHESKHVQYILVCVKQDESLENHIQKVFEIGFSQDAFVELSFISYVSIFFGCLKVDENDLNNRVETIEKLKDELQNNVSILHGQCFCPVGDFGCDYTKRYGPKLENIKDKVQKLSAASFGDIIED